MSDTPMRVPFLTRMYSLVPLEEALVAEPEESEPDLDPPPQPASRPTAPMPAIPSPQRLTNWRLDMPWLVAVSVTFWILFCMIAPSLFTYAAIVFVATLVAPGGCSVRCTRVSTLTNQKASETAHS